MNSAPSIPYNNLPALFWHTCERQEFKGWHYRDHHQWAHASAHELKTALLHTTLALKEMGFGPGQGLGIIAPSSPRWFLLDLAAQICGGYTVPLFPNISSENFRFQLQDAPVHILAIHDPEVIDPPLLGPISQFPQLIGLSHSRSYPAQTTLWESLQETGRQQANDMGFAWFLNQISQLATDSVFSIIYTSGSTGQPKGVPLTHRNMLVQIEGICEMFPLQAGQDSALSVLPVAHVFERMAIYYFLRSGIEVWFADDPKNVGLYLPEIRPSVLTVVPRILERLYEKLCAAPNHTSGPKKWLLRFAIHKARFHDPSHKDWQMKLLEPLVYKKMRQALGNRFKLIVSGSSALNPAVGRFLLNAGFPIFEGYGLTECSPVVSACHPGHQKLGTVGPALPFLNLRISPEGEVQVKGESVFRGYHNRPDLQSDTFTPDGYFRTGDQGEFDSQGFLRLTGRLKELLKTSTGKYVRPVPIELELNRHPLIEAAQVFANNRKYVTTLLFLNLENAKVLLDRPYREFNPDRALQSNRIQLRIQNHIDRVNRKLSDWERIRKWKLVHAELNVEGGLLTPTLKLRRKEVEKRYIELIDSLYNGSEPT